MIKAPFPYFGGKSRVADLVWERFGDVKNYVEPFAGSLAVLLARPHTPGIETVNDADGLLANFWRALAWAPEEVARHADWPVNEADLHARHLWLVGEREEITERLMGDPEWYDAKAAGWWVWGICCWIGTGWCAGDGPWVSVGGVFIKNNSSMGIHRQLPHLGNAGRGIHRQLPHLGDAGMGIHRKLPHLGNAGRGIHKQGSTWEHLKPVAERLRGVRVACGDWSRVCRPSVTYSCQGRDTMLTGVFLDPPYPDGSVDYAAGDREAYQDVTAWALENGDNELLRIAVCGYEGDHDALEVAGWEAVPWKAQGGYGNQGDGQGRDNATRERIWFSPHCLKAQQGVLL